MPYRITARIATQIRAARAWLTTNPDTATATFFILLLTSPALLELLIVRSSVMRELAVLGFAFLLWVVAAMSIARRSGLTVQKAWTFLKKGGRIWELLLLTCWVIVLGINMIIGRGVNARVPLGYFAFFLAVYLVDLFFAMTGRQDQQRWILYAIFVVFAVACFRGMFVLASDPDVARLMATGSFPEAEKHLNRLLGVGGFEFFTGLACVFPMLVYYRMETPKHRFFTVCICLILLGMLFSAYTLVIIFTIFGLLLLLIYSVIRLRGRELRILALLCVLLLVIIAGFLAVGSALRLQQSELYLVKVSDLSVMIADRVMGVQIPTYDPGSSDVEYYGEGSSVQRMELYAISLRTFLQHPLFGVGSRVNTSDYVDVGMHSTWLDYLAMYGALSFGLFLGFMALMFRRVHRMLASHSEKAYRMVALVIYLLYGLVNPVIATAMFPVVLLFYIAGRVKLPGEEPMHV